MEMLEKKNHKAQMMQISLSSLSLHVRMCALLRNMCRCKHKMCAENCLCVCVSLRDCVPQQQQVAGPKTRQ